MSELWDESEAMLDLPSLDGEEEALGLLEPEGADGFLDTVEDAESVGLDDSTGDRDPISAGLLREYMHSEPEPDANVSMLDDGAQGPADGLGAVVDVSDSEYGWLDDGGADSGEDYEADLVLGAENQSFLEDGGELAIEELLAIDEFESQMKSELTPLAEDSSDSGDVTLEEGESLTLFSEFAMESGRGGNEGVEQVRPMLPPVDPEVNETSRLERQLSVACVTPGRDAWWIWSEAGLQSVSIEGEVGDVQVRPPDDDFVATHVAVHRTSLGKNRALVMDATGRLWAEDDGVLKWMSHAPRKSGPYPPGFWLGQGRVWVRTADGGLYQGSDDLREWGAASLPQNVIACTPGGADTFAAVSQPERGLPELLVTTDGGEQWHAFPIEVPDLGKLPRDGQLSCAGVRLLLSFPGRVTNAMRCARPGREWTTLIPRHQLGEAILPKVWPARSFRLVYEPGRGVFLLSALAGKGERTWASVDESGGLELVAQQVSISVIQRAPKTYALVGVGQRTMVLCFESHQPRREAP